MDGRRIMLKIEQGEYADVTQIYGSWIGVDYNGWIGWVHWSDVGVVQSAIERRLGGK